MKVFLDDVRETPEGFVRCYWPDEVIELLKTRQVTFLSLDHDLGDDARGTGYDVLTWLEETIHTFPLFPMPFIWVHSANVSAKSKMEAAIDAMRTFVMRRNL